MSSNCVANSSIAQSKLFLLPNGCEKDIWLYCQFNRMRGQFIRESIMAQDFEPSTCMDAYDTNRVAGAFCTLESLSAVTLCPLLELDDCRKETAMDRIKRNGWHDAERANLIGMPPENTKYIDMILTDPPTFDVEAHLTFKHSLNPTLMVSATRQVSNPGFRTHYRRSFDDRAQSARSGDHTQSTATWEQPKSILFHRVRHRRREDSSEASAVWWKL